MVWSVCIIGDEFGPPPKKFEHGSFTSICGIFAIDFAVAAVHRIPDTSNIYVTTSESSYSLRNEWAISRGIRQKNLLFHCATTSLCQLISSEIAPRYLNDRSDEGIAFISGLHIQDEQFSFSQVFSGDWVAGFDGSAMRLGEGSPDQDCLCLAVKGDQVRKFFEFCSGITSNLSFSEFATLAASRLSIQTLTASTDILLDWDINRLTSRKVDELVSMQLPTDVHTVCPARVGLLGNPSDGFHGRTLSMLIDNFAATVTIQHVQDTRQVTIVPHHIHDSSEFIGLDGLHVSTKNRVSSSFRMLL